METDDNFSLLDADSSLFTLDEVDCFSTFLHSIIIYSIIRIEI